ncbi:hypothetical protein IHE45_02G091100 [Dioscorea alata]|uniref:Uncharacterized protein n=1 Tax=Dioscorea alata TaxID=55571 RepID=A0ACB7WS55_DIOAL|nr:hypothetical protein IHE45_02G091100 [Dioscorea alata]
MVSCSLWFHATLLILTLLLYCLQLLLHCQPSIYPYQPCRCCLHDLHSSNTHQLFLHSISLFTSLCLSH